MSERRWLQLILIATALLGFTYAVVNPVFEGGDELWHYPMVQHLANGNPLPVQVTDPALAGPWKQQASQPPLYYYAAAALTFWIDTSDMETVRWQNPHVDNGIITADGNRNLTIHNSNWSPWQGTLLAVYIVRFFSVLLGVGSVYFTYKLGKLIAPERADIALGAAALVAFLPMRLFVSAAVNNDNGIIFLATVTVYVLALMTTGSKDNKSPWWPAPLTIGALIGLASLTKIVGIGLLPLAFGALFLAHWKWLREDVATHNSFSNNNWLRLIGRILRDFTIVCLITFAICGWWYIRNVQLYDDWRGWSAFIAVLGERNQPATLAQLWDERAGFMQAFWGLFGGVNIPIHGWIYVLLNTVIILGCIGFVIYTLKIIFRPKRPNAIHAHTLSAQPTLRTRNTQHATFLISFLDFTTRHAPVIICLVWVAAIVYGLIDWATTTWSSQGRLVFGALQAEMLLVTLGLVGWQSEKNGRAVMGALGSFMFLVALAAPFIYIGPAYAIVWPDFADVFAANIVPVEAEFTPLRLDQVRVNMPDPLLPNSPIDIYTEWDVLAATDRNWSVFVHLNDTVLNTPIAQRDMYLGQGLLATSFLEPGQRLSNHYRLIIPPTATTPADLELRIGLYDVFTGERLPSITGEGSILLQTATLVAPEDGLSNATAINFEEQLELVGYDISNRRLTSVGQFSVTLYLSPLTQIETDYSITTQIVSEDLTDTTRWAAADTVLPSSQWAVGSINEVVVQMAVNPDAPADVHRLIMGVYTQTDGQFRNLNLVQDGRITNDNLLTLTKVRIEE